MISFNGAGSHGALRALVASTRNSLPIEMPDGAICQLLLVRAYRHLGTSLCVSANASSEAVQRCAMAFQDARKMKRILRDSELSQQERVSFVTTHIISKSLFQEHGCDFGQ